MYSIKRHIEPIVERRARNSKAILLTGPRQVGKSTLFQHLFKDANQVTFDDNLLLAQATDDPGLFLLNNPCPLMIDEVQKCPSIFNRVKIELDKTDEKANFFFTGSQKLQLMEQVSESLSGRVSIVELDGLSLREIHDVDFNRHFVPSAEYLAEREKARKPYERDIWKIIHRGSYPELYANEDKEWIDFYQSYVKTYLERDVNRVIKVTNHLTFVKFMTAVAARTGQIVNYSAIASEVGVSEPTIKEWLSILERSGLVYILKPYTPSVLSRAIKTPKLYFRDTGLACYLTRWLTPETLKNGAMAGAMFETFVINEILKSYPTKPQGYELQFDWYYADGKYESCVKTLKEAFERGVFTERLWQDYESIRYLTSGTYGRYDAYLPMSEGKMLLHGVDGWSYSDGRGNTVINAAYQYAAPFGSSAAYVIQNGTAKLIDDCGNTIVLSEKTYDSAGVCGEGMIPVCENHIWRYVNTDMEPVLGTFQYAGSFCNGVAAVKNDSVWSIIRNDGNAIVGGLRDVKMDPLGRCAPNGYIVADAGNGYSLYDVNMNLISGTAWQDADVCYGEYIAVSDGKSWGYIDTTGMTVISNQYSEAFSFANGFAVVSVDTGGADSAEQSEKMGLIDTSGTLVVPAEFDELSCVNESRGFLAKEDGIWHIKIFVSDINESEIRR